MSLYKLSLADSVELGPLAGTFMRLCIQRNDKPNTESLFGKFSTHDLFVDTIYIHDHALFISKHPDVESVTIECKARVKARYASGHCIGINDMRDFYDNLTDEEYQQSKILVNREWR